MVIEATLPSAATQFVMQGTPARLAVRPAERGGPPLRGGASKRCVDPLTEKASEGGALRAAAPARPLAAASAAGHSAMLLSLQEGMAQGGTPSAPPAPPPASTKNFPAATLLSPSTAPRKGQEGGSAKAGAESSVSAG